MYNLKLTPDSQGRSGQTQTWKYWIYPHADTGQFVAHPGRQKWVYVQWVSEGMMHMWYPRLIMTLLS